VTTVLAGAAFRRASGERHLNDVVFEGCSFDNCRVRGGTFSDVRFTDARTWSCGLDDVVLRNCTIDGLRMSLGGAGGRTMPLIVHGVLADRVTLRGPIGSLIWNRPGSLTHPVPEDEAVRRAEDFYGQVTEFALDVSAAEFSAVPSLRYGPPGHLVVRDPGTQPLVSLAEAQRLVASGDPELGVWRFALREMVRLSWPESIVLVPATRAPKRQRDRDLAALAHVRSRLSA
jgi:hypothetical protein